MLWNYIKLKQMLKKLYKKQKKWEVFNILNFNSFRCLFIQLNQITSHLLHSDSHEAGLVTR